MEKNQKIDAHIHILPPERLCLWKESPEDAWSHADIDEYLQIMDTYHVECALLMPANDGRLYYEDTPFVLEHAVKECGLKGLKIHPSNLNLNADSLEMVPVLRKAAELHVPVAIHSYPCRVGFHDDCAPDRINKMIQIFPDVTFITAHMGGMKWQDAINGCGYVDISAVLPELVELYGIEQTNRILRRFGADRLIFATDYPDVRFTKPENIYKTYCDILNQMDFTEIEAEKIAYGNIAKIMGIVR